MFRDGKDTLQALFHIVEVTNVGKHLEEDCKKLTIAPAVGVIEELGPGVVGFEIGERVGFMPASNTCRKLFLRPDAKI